MTVRQTGTTRPGVTLAALFASVLALSVLGSPIVPALPTLRVGLQ
jgi:hypothetical protein